MISNVVVAYEDDIRCLKGIQAAAFKDPLRILESWIFGNSKEDRLSSVSLTSNELSGHIPDSLPYYASTLQILDLSDSKISGTILSKICCWLLPYLTALDLSGNRSIPPNLANCTYLNKLIRLSNNRLSNFSVAYNDLSGQIPTFESRFSPESFEGNNGLYDQPLAEQRAADLPLAGCEKIDALCWLMI
ncbi:hypothetical protein MKX01_012845 [Papaver californicum]|nr:hypothetical protein MKX01_012845 [Papaver californicum]